MESPFLLELREHLHGTPLAQARLRDALGRLEHLVGQLAQDLQIPHLGPSVGIGRQGDAQRLCVADHHWTGAVHAWGVAVCSTSPTGTLRADWHLAKVSRERLPRVVAALPQFFREYAALAVGQAGERASSQRLLSIAELLNETTGTPRSR